ncbi:MAG TPA: hypothetical protein VGY30_01230 [Solirubrobacteraceae bacterium]|nr:hypothetical protein [Solirubrobacteraceae bacterium]
MGVVRDALSGPFASILANLDEVDPRSDRIELVPPTVVAERAEKLQQALEGAMTRDSHSDYALRAIAGAIGRCLVYVSAREILVRPFIPPTRDLVHFADASQRLYMSATLGAGGELERAFGVHKIRRIPAEATQQRSGRRLILMPGLRIDEGPADQVIRDAIAATPRTALIAPSTRALEEATGLLPPFTPTMDADQIQEFIQTEPAVLGLANRYDGIDLPDRQCRLIVLSGLPAYGHSQERFLFETVGATRVLTERIRTRIIQGAGRATRNRQDYAAVILRGDDLLRFIQRDQARSEMRPELQVELEVGEYYSRNNDVELADILQTFWKHDQDWQPIETHLREQVAARQRTDDPVSVALAAAAPHEVQAWWSCWQGDLSGAADAARAAIAQLVGESLRPYRAIWEYFAASWATILATEQPQSDASQAAAQLRQSAEATARTLRWFPRFTQEPNLLPVGPEYDARAERTTQWMRQVNTRSRRFDETIARITEQVHSDEPNIFHQGLQTLGLALGFEAWRDNNSAACPDGAWRDDDRLWILFEAKTLQQAETPLAANDVRQANSHDNWMQANQGWTPLPTQLITAIVSLRETIGAGTQTVADPDVTLVHPQVVRSIADRTVAMLNHLRGLPATLNDSDLTQTVSQQLVEHQLDNRSLIAFFAQRSIRDTQPQQ